MKSRSTYDTIFDPEKIDKKAMRDLAEALETYLDQLLEVMVIPKDMEEDYGDKIRDSIKVVKKLIKKLKNGDKSVFKDID